MFCVLGRIQVATSFSTAVVPGKPKCLSTSHSSSLRKSVKDPKYFPTYFCFEWSPCFKIHCSGILSSFNQVERSDQIVEILNICRSRGRALFAERRRLTFHKSNPFYPFLKCNDYIFQKKIYWSSLLSSCKLETVHLLNSRFEFR